MNESYEYRRIETAVRSWPRVLEQFRARARPAVESAAGRVFGLWLPQIGLAANEGVIMTAWPDVHALERGAGTAVEGLEDVLDSTAERLVATVRPQHPDPPPAGGIYAHRFFGLRESDWPQFLELSERAWPGFEKSFDTRIIGFFRSLDVEPPAARVLLLTRYGSLAVWEQSRMAGARSEEQDRIRERFQRRHQLTSSTVVVTTQLAQT